MTHTDWPFFEDRPRTLAGELEAWCSEHLHFGHAEDVDAECIGLVRKLGAAGWLDHAVGGGGRSIHPRPICLLRETLARHNGLADFAFAMQGLGSGAISLDG